MATRSLGTLTLDLIAKIGGFTQGMDQASRVADKRMREIERRANAFGRSIGSSIKSAATGFLAFAGVTVTIGAALEGLKGAVDRADELRDLSIRLGTSTETLSAFGYAAAQTGTDMDALSKGMKILAKNAADALNPTSEQAKVFDSLGVSVVDSTGNLKQMGQLIPEIADKFRALEDGTTKAALAQSLFGKSGLDLTEFLNSGSQGLQEFSDKAARLGIIVGKDAADAADKFNDDLNDLKTAAQGLALEVAQSLLPHLDKMVTWATDFVSEGGHAEDAAHGIASGFRDMAEAGKSLSQVVAFLQQIHSFLAASDDLAKNFFGTFSFGQSSKFGDMLKRNFPALYKSPGGGGGSTSGFTGPSALQIPVLNGGGGFNATAGRFDATAGVGGGTSVNAQAVALALSNPTAAHAARAKGGKSDAERQADQLKAAYDRLIESQQEQIALFGKTGEAAQARYDVEFGDLKNLTQAQKDVVVANAERLDQMQAEADLAKALDDIAQQRQDAVAGVLADLKTEKDLLGATNEERATYNALMQAGTNLTEADRQAITAHVHELYEQGQAIQAQADAMDGLRDASRTFLDDLKQGIGVWDALKDAVDSFADALFKIIADNLIKRAFGEQGSTSGGGWGGAISSLFGAVFGGGKAGGGPVTPGRVYEVGEYDRPELLMSRGKQYLIPGNQGAVVPIGGRSGGFTQVINNNYSAPNDPLTQRQAAADMGYAANLALRRNNG